MTNKQPRSSGWWQTIPGILTALAGVITAIAGLIVALHKTGLLNHNDIIKPQKVAEIPLVTGKDQSTNRYSSNTKTVTTTKRPVLPKTTNLPATPSPRATTKSEDFASSKPHKAKNTSTAIPSDVPREAVEICKKEVNKKRLDCRNECDNKARQHIAANNKFLIEKLESTSGALQDVYMKSYLEKVKEQYEPCALGCNQTYTDASCENRH